jgi:hypothetical protein
VPDDEDPRGIDRTLSSDDSHGRDGVLDQILVDGEHLSTDLRKRKAALVEPNADDTPRRQPVTEIAKRTRGTDGLVAIQWAALAHQDHRRQQGDHCLARRRNGRPQRRSNGGL